MQKSQGQNKIESTIIRVYQSAECIRCAEYKCLLRQTTLPIKTPPTNCKHAAFCLGFVYSEGSRMWRGAQIPSFMRFCLCLALRSLHAQPCTSFEHFRIWGPMESHMWPCCGLSNLCKAFQRGFNNIEPWQNILLQVINFWFISVHLGSS